MAEPCDVAEESFALNDHLRAATVSRAVEAVALGDGQGASKVAQKVVEVMVLDDGASMRTVIAFAREALALGDATKNVVEGMNEAVEHVVIGDRLRSTQRNLVAEALVFNDGAAAKIPAQRVRESFVFDDRAGFGARLVNHAAESVLVSAATHQQAFRMLSEALTLHSTAIDRQTIHQHAFEAFVLNDAGQSRGTFVNEADESFRLNDAASHVAEGSNTAREAVFLADDAGDSQDVGGAWAASTDTFAMSRYTHKRIEAIAVIGGIIFAATADGIFAMTGDDDEGEPIDALATTGMQDTATPATEKARADTSLRHASYAYVAYSGGRMRFGIGITGNGVEERYFYDFPERTATAPTVNRTRIGRGARSRFWRFLIGNVEGDMIRVTDARVPLDPSSRRI
jgi:hypothetical protein